MKIVTGKNVKYYNISHKESKRDLIKTHSIRVRREIANIETHQPKAWKSRLRFTVVYEDDEILKVPGNYMAQIDAIMRNSPVKPAYKVAQPERDQIFFKLCLNETVMRDDGPRVVFEQTAIHNIIYNVFRVLLAFETKSPMNTDRPRKRKNAEISEEEVGRPFETESENEQDDVEVDPALDAENEDEPEEPAPVVEAQAPIVQDVPAGTSIVEAQARIVQDVPVGTSIVEAQAPVVQDVPADTSVVQAQARIVQDVPADTSIVEAQAQVVTDIPADIPIVSAEPIMSDVDLQTFVDFTLGRGNGPSLAEPALTGVAEAVQAMVAPVPAGVAEAGPAEAQIKPDPVQDPKTEILRLLMEDDVDRGAIIGLLDLLEEKKKIPDLKVYETDVLVKIINEATTEMQSRISNMAKKEEANKDSNGESKEEPEDTSTVDLTGDD